MAKLKIINEFKEFAIKGNVVDMAVGVIIGGAFSKIVTSLVNDIVMPALGIIIGRVNFSELSVTINPFDEGGTPIEVAYGMFLQNVLDFFIVAISIFAMIKVINMLKRKDEVQAEPEEAKPSDEVLLLTEIRDILNKDQ